jgi:predicted DNA-binding transcriptional regulator AlpA
LTAMNEQRRWLTVAEAAAYLGISVKGAYDMAASGKLPAARDSLFFQMLRIDRIYGFKT